MFPVWVKTAKEEHLIEVQQSINLPCEDGTLCAGLSFTQKSYRTKDSGINRMKRVLSKYRTKHDDFARRRYGVFSRLNRTILALPDKNLSWDHHVFLDSGYTYTDVAADERFFIDLEESEFGAGEYCHTPRLVRENGGEADEIMLFPKEKDETLAEFRKTRHAGRRIGVVLIFLYTAILAAIMVIFWKAVYWLFFRRDYYKTGYIDLIYALIITIVLVYTNISDTVEQYRDDDFVEEFCCKEKT